MEISLFTNQRKNDDVENETDEELRTKEQHTRAVLREKFLRFVSSVAGECCEMKTVENNDLSGIYHGMDIHVQDIFVKDMSTPYSNLKNGLLRTQDLLYVTFPDIGKKEKSKMEPVINKMEQ